MKIVVYIRALFDGVKKGGLEQKNFITAAAKFTELANISFLDYRKQLHEIQKINLTQIADRIIVNNNPEGVSGVSPFFRCLPSTLEELARLDDDDVIIPLDDDDWLSPEIKNVDFNSSGLTCWDSYFVSVQGLGNLPKNVELPEILNAEELAQSKLLAASGYAVSAKVIKKALKLSDSLEMINLLLQRHSRAREMIRTLGGTEKIVDARLSVYLKHAANMTLIHPLDTEEHFQALDFFKKHVLPHKNFNFSGLKLPADLAWCTRLLIELMELNKKL
jgi:hypothetical protein